MATISELLDPTRPDSVATVLDRQLDRIRAAHGFMPRDVELLRSVVRVVPWLPGADRDTGSPAGSLFLLLRGAAVVEATQCIADVGVAHAGCRRRRTVFVQMLAPGELFGVPSDPSTSERLQLRAYPTVSGDHVAIVALWEPAALRRIMGLVSPAALMSLMTSTWSTLSYVAEQKSRWLTLNVEDRLSSVLSDLVRRFGRPSDQGTWIDLRLSDGMLARMVCTTRSTVNRKLNHGRFQIGAVERRGDALILRCADPTGTAPNPLAAAVA